MARIGRWMARIGRWMAKIGRILRIVIVKRKGGRRRKVKIRGRFMTLLGRMMKW